jgi:hypothetical protein
VWPGRQPGFLLRWLPLPGLSGSLLGPMSRVGLVGRLDVARYDDWTYDSHEHPDGPPNHETFVPAG